MAVVFAMTASVGFVYSYAFIKTRAIYLSIALHLGANFSTMLLFSKDNTIGAQLLVKTYLTDPIVPNVLIGTTMVILHFIGYQCFTFILVKWYGKNYHSPISTTNMARLRNGKGDNTDPKCNEMGC